MKISFSKLAICLIIALVVFGLMVPAGFSKDAKIGYVDLRRAFYEYEKTKTLETELTELTESSQADRTKLVEEITKLRDEAELLSGTAREQKQGAIDAKLAELQDFDRKTRQLLLNKKNDMFRQVIDDIQKVVEGIGKKDGYDYVLDSRNIMYANESFDLTDVVLKQLNK